MALNMKASHSSWSKPASPDPLPAAGHKMVMNALNADELAIGKQSY